MLLASSSNSYPLLGVFWTIFEIFLFVIWFWILITVFIDIFRSQDLSGGAKALWFLFVLFIPLIGVLVYLIVRGSSMHERAAQQAQQQDEAFRSYVQEAAGEQSSTTDQLAKLADLRDRGVITPQEFESQKAKILA
jgi:membrane protein implicated in regulation of membrane protease activity